MAAMSMIISFWLLATIHVGAERPLRAGSQRHVADIQNHAMVGIVHNKCSSGQVCCLQQNTKTQSPGQQEMLNYCAAASVECTSNKPDLFTRREDKNPNMWNNFCDPESGGAEEHQKFCGVSKACCVVEGNKYMCMAPERCVPSIIQGMLHTRRIAREGEASRCESPPTHEPVPAPEEGLTPAPALAPVPDPEQDQKDTPEPVLAPEEAPAAEPVHAAVEDPCAALVPPLSCCLVEHSKSGVLDYDCLPKCDKNHDANLEDERDLNKCKATARLLAEPDMRHLLNDAVLNERIALTSKG